MPCPGPAALSLLRCPRQELERHPPTPHTICIILSGAAPQCSEWGRHREPRHVAHTGGPSHLIRACALTGEDIPPHCQRHPWDLGHVAPIRAGFGIGGED
ncbi:hypothetical protein NDU88_003108 [Pleurodeles waltl]|uniref:Uncharacterized protein n=1 Tax=Pleurodeles waltl TaxID=8319 RepID=A0AAV7WRV5_PLEWA|nr:hypothetical protein NDU88_003108 [Pleurodeles waltl]